MSHFDPKPQPVSSKLIKKIDREIDTIVEETVNLGEVFSNKGDLIKSIDILLPTFSFSKKKRESLMTLSKTIHTLLKSQVLYMKFIQDCGEVYMPSLVRENRDLKKRLDTAHLIIQKIAGASGKEQFDEVQTEAINHLIDQ